jgi:hypothetical protein
VQGGQCIYFFAPCSHTTHCQHTERHAAVHLILRNDWIRRILTTDLQLPRPSTPKEILLQLSSTPNYQSSSSL